MGNMTEERQVEREEEKKGRWGGREGKREGREGEGDRGRVLWKETYDY